MNIGDKGGYRRKADFVTEQIEACYIIFNFCLFVSLLSCICAADIKNLRDGLQNFEPCLSDEYLADELVMERDKQ